MVCCDFDVIAGLRWVWVWVCLGLEVWFGVCVWLVVVGVGVLCGVCLGVVRVW